jgi:hypothetical protein
MRRRRMAEASGRVVPPLLGGEADALFAFPKILPHHYYYYNRGGIFRVGQK